jgi:FemAB-related protein (PEP-CTERM system-associated)
MAWKNCIEEVFGYRALYLMAFEGGRVRGCLPLFLVENMLIGRILLSTPFAVYGGVLADSPEVAAAFGDQLTTLGQALSVDHVELRNAYDEQCVGFARISRYVTFTRQIGNSEEAILESIPRKTRYMVRKALKQGFETSVCNERSAAFEDLYDRNLRRLGTPSFPSKFFASLLKNFGSGVDIREVLWNGKVASAVLTFYFRDQVLPYYGASALKLNALAPNNFMYFDLMRRAGKSGYAKFDFGRSKKHAGGSYDFKAYWGMEERELPYEILLVRRKELPNFTPANPIFKLPRKAWQRLPLFVTKGAGPLFIRLVP